ncbi:unnamed protein product [Somion occarium]|uniref:ASX DEUBAD domain-containing protein n=1 Tax=Somion occarium TaxID=3059160 RepID=A0ABP1D3E3_9APHY
MPERMNWTRGVLNYENFINLSAESQQKLCNLLPPTAFCTYQRTVDPTHPCLRRNSRSSGAGSMDVDTIPGPSSESSLNDLPERSPATLDPSIFTSSFFQSAALTFQDQLFSSWFSQKAKETQEKYERGVRDGTMHAEWKDEVWERENDVSSLTRNTHGTDLAGLAKRSLIKEGDMMVYKRTFSSCNVTVEKDLLVHFVNPQSHSLTLLLPPNVDRNLPPQLLVICPPEPKPPTLNTDGILSSVELEHEILETDGRVSRAERYTEINDMIKSRRTPLTSMLTHDPFDTAALATSAKAAKSLSVWRWREEMKAEIELQMIQERGGRELLGTIYHLRNS